jgi:predicted RNA binding protein YcfA (HicA-like mRNA interferase family)
MSFRQVISIFRRFGFEIVSQEGSHVKLRRYPDSGDEQNIMVPRHRDIDTGTLRAIYRQAIQHIPERQLRRDFYTD